jgi:hypothetical protein
MNLEKVLEIANECVANEIIETKGLTITYKLNEVVHKNLDQELYLKTNNSLLGFKHNEIIELIISDIVFVFELE